MNKPTIFRISELHNNKSTVYLFAGEEIPATIPLTESERCYAQDRFNEKDDIVVVNTYARFIYLVRLVDKKQHFEVREALRMKAASMKKLFRENRDEEIAVVAIDTYPLSAIDYAEGISLAVYAFDKFISQEKESKKGKIYPTKIGLKGAFSDKDLESLNITTEAVYWVRDTINEPVSNMDAESFANQVVKLGESAQFDVEILTYDKIKDLEMGGLLAVNRGSVTPPTFSILTHRPENAINEKPIVLVGKGIMYDTGGLNIKTGNYMDGMKGDMAGAAAVAGTMTIVARLRLPIYVIALIPATDNRPSGNAYTQGDIIKMYNKKSVEVANTDAEGRLILADAIAYASNFSPELIIDIATLTGSAANTFGSCATAIMGNADRKYLDLLEKGSEDVFERLAELPFWECYGELIKSDVADICNSSKGKGAGAITAGKFLENFATAPYIHLDIAGTGMISADDGYRVKEFTGIGVRLLAQFLKLYSLQK